MDIMIITCVQNDQQSLIEMFPKIKIEEKVQNLNDLILISNNIECKY